MKILHIVWALATGGLENMLVDIINYQVKSEDVTLLLVNDWYDKSIMGRLDKRCQVKILGRKVGSKSPLFLLKLNSYLLFHNYDIIHLHDPNMIRNLWLKKNYVRTVHNTNIEYHNYRWHKCIIAISQAVHDDLTNRGFSSVVVDNGVNFNLIRSKLNFEKGKIFNMVQVSRILFEQKGQDILLESLIKLKQKGIKNFHLDFIGTGPDEERLSEMISSKEMENFVSLLGCKSREYIYEHLCRYDLYVQPSRFEGFGLTVAEAIGAKIPVLVSDNEGPLAIIENGKYGFTFKNKSVDDCADEIEKIMNNYPSTDFINAAYNRITALYKIDYTAQKYIDEYKKIINKK